jgi:putative transposase
MFTDAQRSLYYEARGLHPVAIREIEEMRASSPARDISQRGLKNTIVDFFSTTNQRRWKLESYTSEFLHALYLEVFGGCDEYYAQVQPKNVVRNGRTNSITVDFMVFDQTGIRLVECKPRNRLEALGASKPDEWVCHEGRWTRPPVDAWARERGMTYAVWSPPEPHGIYQANLLALYGMASATACKEADALCVRRLCKALQNTPLTIRAALDLISGLSGVHILAALAKGHVFGPLQSVLIDEPDRFMLFAVKSQAVECDEQLLSQLEAHITQPSVDSKLLLASPTDYSGAQRRLARVNQILAGVVPSTRRYACLVRAVIQARADGKSDLEACLTCYANAGRRVGQLTGDQEIEIRAAISRYRSDALIRTKVQAHDHLVMACERKGIRPPGRTTFNARLRQSSDLKRAYTEGGYRGYHAAERASDPGDRTLRCSVPGLMVHIDSTKFDLRCSPDFLTALGFDCPTLYVAMDSATGMPLGYAVLFGPACRNALAVLIRDILHRQDFLPRYWIADGGSEYIGPWFEAACSFFGATRIQPPPGTPRRNSLAENALGRINAELAHRFLGSTAPDQKGRSVTSRQKSYATACHVYSTIMEHLEKYLFEDVPEAPLLSTRFSANDRNEELTRLYGNAGVVRVENPDDFLIATSVPLDRGITADSARGIRYLQRTYASTDLMKLLRFQKPIEMRLDCVDPHRMYVRFPSKWVLAMTAQNLRTGGRDTATKLFGSLMDNTLRSEGAERRDQLRRERAERIAEANLAAKSADHLTYMLDAANDVEPEPEKARVWSDLKTPIAPFTTESGDL